MNVLEKYQEIPFTTVVNGQHAPPTLFQLDTLPPATFYGDHENTGDRLMHVKDILGKRKTAHNLDLQLAEIERKTLPKGIHFSGNPRFGNQAGYPRIHPNIETHVYPLSIAESPTALLPFVETYCIDNMVHAGCLKPTIHQLSAILSNNLPLFVFVGHESMRIEKKHVVLKNVAQINHALFLYNDLWVNPRQILDNFRFCGYCDGVVTADMTPGDSLIPIVIRGQTNRPVANIWLACRDPPCVSGMFGWLLLIRKTKTFDQLKIIHPSPQYMTHEEKERIKPIHPGSEPFRILKTHSHYWRLEPYVTVTRFAPIPVSELSGPDWEGIAIPVGFLGDFTGW